MLNMQAAVLAAQRPFAVAEAATVIASGVEVPLEGRNSFAANGRIITAYQWSLAQRDRRRPDDCGNLTSERNAAGRRRKSIHAAFDGHGRSGRPGLRRCRDGDDGAFTRARSNSDSRSCADGDADACALGRRRGRCEFVADLGAVSACDGLRATAKAVPTWSQAPLGTR